MINKKLIIIALSCIFILVSGVVLILFINYHKNKTVNNVNNSKNKNINANVKKINTNSLSKFKKNENCVKPQRGSQCSKLSLKECEKSNFCEIDGRSCVLNRLMIPPKSYFEGLEIAKKNCKISGGAWYDKAGTYNSGLCECPYEEIKVKRFSGEGYSTQFQYKGEAHPADGFCGTNADRIKMKPQEVPKIVEILSRRHIEVSANRIGIAIDDLGNKYAYNPIYIILNDDYNNFNEAEYIACLVGGEVVGFLFSGRMPFDFQIKIPANTPEEAEEIQKIIEKEPTVMTTINDTVMGSFGN